jgi:hypothetical protein
MRPIDAAVEVADDRLHWVAVIRRQTTNGRYGVESGLSSKTAPSQKPPSN